MVGISSFNWYCAQYRVVFSFIYGVWQPLYSTSTFTYQDSWRMKCQSLTLWIRMFALYWYLKDRRFPKVEIRVSRSVSKLLYTTEFFSSGLFWMSINNPKPRGMIHLELVLYSKYVFSKSIVLKKKE